MKSLQVLRAVAATMVVFLHAVVFAGVDLPPRWAFVGAAGVDIFFVLSGAIIWRTAFAGERTRPDVFLQKRLTRVVPFYWFVTAVWVAYIILVAPDWRMEPFAAATTLSFWPAWGRLYTPLLGIGWTLCFEMLFYTGAAVALRWRRAWIWLAFMFVCAWALRDLTHWPAMRFLGNPIILEFALGMLIMAVWRPASPLPLVFGLSLLGIGLVALSLAEPPAGFTELKHTLNSDLSIPRLMIWGLPACLILTAALSLEPHLRGDWLKGPVFLGDASYAIYLTHWPFLVALRTALDAPRGPWVLAAYVTAAVLFGAVTHFVVERRLLRLLRGPKPVAVAA